MKNFNIAQRKVSYHRNILRFYSPDHYNRKTMSIATAQSPMSSREYIKTTNLMAIITPSLKLSVGNTDVLKEICRLKNR